MPDGFDPTGGPSNLGKSLSFHTKKKFFLGWAKAHREALSTLQSRALFISPCSWRSDQRREGCLRLYFPAELENEKATLFVVLLFQPNPRTRRSTSSFIFSRAFRSDPRTSSSQPVFFSSLCLFVVRRVEMVIRRFT
ncbi:unnamed protein product [Linum trigynum]|uniref:Uncharacterized protein n=1 Tax=Linum trigynum TaxID=586398 RepID=A0AAV2FUF9_9ROSI